MGWGIALGLLLLLWLLPLGADLRYSGEGLDLWLKIGPVRKRLLPRKDPKKGTEKDSTAPVEKKASLPKKRPKTGGSLEKILPLARIVLELLGDFRRRLWVNRLELEVLLAEDDPCDLAVHCGQAWAVLEGLMPQLDRAFRIRKKRIWVGCDFAAEETLVYARLDAAITLGHLLLLAVRYGSRFFAEYTKWNDRKGGRVT